MPWECKSCVKEVEDDSVCPDCGSSKESWTVIANKTRTMRLTKGKKVSYLLGNEREPRTKDHLYEGEQLDPATYAVAVPKAKAKDWHEKEQAPSPAELLFVRMLPKATDQDLTTKLTLHFDTQEIGQQEVPKKLEEVELDENGAYEARFLLVYGPEPLAAEVSFKDIAIIDISEENDAGHAPMVGVSALAKKRRDLPIQSLKKSVQRLSCAKLQFNTDSAIVMGSGLPVIQAALQHVRDNPDHLLLIASHTDTQGSDESNLDLSLARSKNVLDAMMGRSKAWAEDNERDNSHKNQDIRQTLKWAYQAWNFQCDPGEVTNAALTSTIKQDILQFKKDFRRQLTQNHVTSDLTSEPDADFWRRTLSLYGHLLKERLGLNTRGEIRELCNSIKWVDPDQRAIGCGEKYPLIDSGQNKDEIENRRTEFLFFEPGQEPAPGELESVYSSGEYEFTDLDCPPVEFFDQEIPEGNVVFVIDISGSMSPTNRDGQVVRADRIGRAKRALNTAIDALDEKSKFTVVAYNNVVQLAHRVSDDRDSAPRVVEAKRAAKDLTMTWVNVLRAGGRTATRAAILRALKCQDLDPSQPKTLKVLTDGSPTPAPGFNIPQEQTAILRNVAAASAGWQIDVIGFFDTPNPTGSLPTFLNNLATQNSAKRGTYTPVYVPAPAGAGNR